MVVLEAMASGVAVLGGERSGAVPWLLSGGAGVLVDVRRPKEIADGLNALLGSRSLAEKTATLGLARARDHFSVDAVASAYRERLMAIATETV